MTNKDLEQLLRRAKNAPEFGGDVDGSSREASWSRISRELGFSEQALRREYTFADYADYVGHLLGQHVLRPVSFGLSVFALIFGGWVTTVNASFDSVPGDILYPVKLVTERMQITLASSGERRARLHAEFASRRLQEVVEITNSSREGKEGLVKVAVAGFKQELADANYQLTSVDTPQESASIAMVLDRKADEYEAVISQSGPSLSDESKESVAEALVAAEETDTQAVDALVVSHEATQEQMTADRLQQNFQQTFKATNLRITVDLGRISVLETALNAAGLLDESHEAQLQEARTALEGHEKTMSDAMDLLAIGGYRRAFELVGSVEDSISAAEDIIVPLEIDLSTARAAQEEENKEEEAVSQPEVASNEQAPPAF